MANNSGWLARLVDGLPDSKIFNFLANRVLVPYWAWRFPTKKAEGGPRPSIAPSDNIQRMMNLVMRLKDPSTIGRAKAALVLAQHAGEIFSGVDNVATVHFARFVIIGDYLCMISVYDGDFSNYIRDFISAIGSFFDAIVALVEDGDTVLPTETHIEAFIDWVHARDLFQAPDVTSDLFAINDTARGIPPGAMATHQLRSLSRELILQLRVNPNLSLGGGYRAYPGVTSAQIREQVGMGW
jgi:hypothetical protein